MTKKPTITAPAAQDLISSLKEKNTLPSIDRFTVVKRNGAIVPFKRDRIHRAIDLAFHDTRKIAFDTVLSPTDQDAVEKVTDQVIELLFTQASKGASLTVEGIQDMAEVTLMKMGYHDVARDYIIYRDQHKHLREDSPQNLKIHRKDGSLVRFNPMKIAASIEVAFRRAGKIEDQTPAAVISSVNDLTEQVVKRAVAMHKAGEQIHVSTIQDEIEHLLMKEGYYLVAKDYILYRATNGQQTAASQEEKHLEEGKREFTVLTQEGKTRVIKESHIKNRIKFACRDLKEVSVDDLLETLILNFYEGIKELEVDQAAIMAARTKIEVEPTYSKVAARLLCDTLYREAMETGAADNSLESTHQEYFKKYITFGISVKRLSPSLLEFDLEKLGKAMDLKRDDLFSYLGLQTLYDRYFIHNEERRLETPQIFWMRVSMGLALSEGEKKNERAIEFYNLLSQFLFTSATPTLFNSGTTHSQLSSCFLSTVMDDLGQIFKIVSDDAQLSKWAGGIGNDWTNVRATGAMIKGTNGRSQGIIPFLKVANDTAVAVNQCFAPDTLIYTAAGIVPISEIEVGDLVLGTSGRYREVTETFAYNQHDAMVAITPKHSLTPISVTAGHPFYAIRNVPEKQSISRTLGELKKGTYQCEWVEAGTLQKGDYIAQVIPQEVVPVAEFTEDDARLYGILLGDGHMTKDGTEWEVSGNPSSDEHLAFVRAYLRARGINSWETAGNEHDMQIRWAAGKGAVKDGATGSIVGSGAPTLPFEHTDLYDAKGRKHIAPRLSHLPRQQTLAMIQGLIKTDGNVSRDKEITFSTLSQPLAEGLRYQLLRMGVPTAGKFHKKNWFIHNQYLFTRIKKQEKIATVPFVYDLKVDVDESYMTTAGLAHNGGKRKGAMCAYLETWHLDIEDFLDLRKNTGDDRRRTHDMNTANWIPDLFMKRVAENGSWTLFSPSDTPDLHDLYGTAFEKRYTEYEKLADSGKLKLHKRMDALELWRKMLSMLFETGHPWITFKDPSNIRSPQDHVGVVHSSNLCTEILLNTSKEETAVCNLGSINLELHTTPNGIDEEKLQTTIRTAVRMLDNVIDINFYPIPEAQTSNAKHRPIGMGLMGFQDALYIQNISYASHEAVEFADKSM
jgi:ribonucleoside-diphosphate reductase alpha chain